MTKPTDVYLRVSGAIQITQEYLKSRLSYNPESGDFIWLSIPDYTGFKTGWNTKFPGTIAGSKNSHGYIFIGFGEKKIGAHRLAFLYMTGSFPENEVDHINGIRTDNRWENLRAVTRSENNRNLGRRYNNKTGIPGVVWVANKRYWQVNIGGPGHRIYLGKFDNLLDAAAAKKSAELLHGFHPNHGRPSSPEAPK